MSINLDEARAARLEAEGKEHSITFGGEVYALPPELPFKLLSAITGLDGQDPHAAISGVLEELMGAEAFASFMGHEPSLNDMRALVQGLTADYGLGEELGEASASPPVS